METPTAMPPVEISLEVQREIAELKNGTFAINDAGDLEFAGAILQKIKAMRNWIASKFDPLINATHAAHKAACAQKNELDAPLKMKEDEFKMAVGNYNLLEKRKREEEQRKAQQEADAFAAAQHQAQMAEMKKNGLKEEAKVLKEMGPVSIPVVLPTQAPKIAGVSVSSQWTWELEDINLLPTQFVIKTPNKAMLDGLARAQKDKAVVPGVRFFERPRVATRSA